MSVIILIPEGEDWTPAHPGKISDMRIANALIEALQRDGYATAVALYTEGEKEYTEWTPW